MRASQRCGAKTRKGTPCEAPAIAGKARCRMHGGKGSGAPLGNTNALKDGLYTREELAFHKEARELIRQGREFLDQN